MKKEKKYCVYCGEVIAQKHLEGKIRDYCPSCNSVFYENPLPVASSIVVNEKRQVLLVQRKKDPYKSEWCLPIGFAESGEAVEEAAIRELKEEAGIDGEIIGLIDVDTVENYFYGSLAIITYEVKKIGGSVSPGDDASDAQYFSLDKIPKLAWSSNEKALRMYIELHQDEWQMIDSFKSFLPERDKETLEEIIEGVDEQKSFLSNMLIHFINSHEKQILDTWQRDVHRLLPAIADNIELLTSLIRNIFRGIQFWLARDKTIGIEEFIEAGFQLKDQSITLPDVLSALALSRRALWKDIVGKRLFTSPLEIYTTLELNNRIIFYYDKIYYYISLGYFHS